MNLGQPAWLLLLLALPLGAWMLRPRTGRQWGQVALRALIWTALVLALADAQAVQRLDRVATLFLVDASDSLPAEAQQAQRDFIRQALAGKAEDDLWGVLAYGGQAQLIQGLTSSEQPPAPWQAEQVRPDQTDIARAISSGLALLPAGGARRLVLLSDGQPTQGDALSEAERARALGVELSIVPLRGDDRPDLRLSALSAPSQVGEGQRYDVEVVVSSDEAAQATLQLFAGGALVSEQAVTLRAGDNRFSLPQTAQGGGLQALEARIIPQGADRTPRNDALAGFTRVVGAERAWVVRQDAARGQAIIAALEAGGFLVEVRSPADLPASPAGLADVASVVLVDVPASAFSARQLLALRDYVAELGGGLALVGGGDSYALGGYDRTPLEEMAPLEMRLRDRQRLPRLAVAYVIDRSGSMGAPDLDSRFTNLQLAQQAILLSVELLQPDDRVGVVGFDQRAEVIAPFQDAQDIPALQERVASLLPGGGTSLLAGLNLTEPDLLAQETDARHLILLTDGGTNDRQLVERAQALRAAGITLSVIGIGTGQPGFLVQMAQVGEGQYHSVTDARQIPRVFAQETAFASRAYAVERDFTPSRTAAHPILAGLDVAALRGYVASTAKDAATVILSSGEPYDDPILAAWPYGLGRVAAFTSDDGTRWAADWNGPQAALWWGQLVGWTVTRRADDLQARITLQADGQALLSVEAQSEDGFRDGLALSANLLAPDGRSADLPLEQVASGRYEARFLPQGEGTYFVAVQQPDGAGRTLEGWALGYSAEYAPLRPQDADLLARLAALGGGSDLSAEPAASFARTLPTQVASAPLAPLLLLLALLLWPLDIALRRLTLTRQDWRRLWARLRPTRAAASLEGIDALQGAKARARDRLTPQRPAPAAEMPPQDAPRPSAPAPSEEAAGTQQAVSTLLEKRRQQRKTD